MTIRLWVCDEATEDGDGCEASDPCEDGGCGWREYADLAAMLAARWLTCAWCEARSDDEHPTKVPQWHAGWYHCSAACVRKSKADQARYRAARRDWHACLARSGLTGNRIEYLGLCGDGVESRSHPAGLVHTPTFTLTLRLGTICHVGASLEQWHEATGLPMPAATVPQTQWMAMLRDWLTASGVGKVECDAWRAAEGVLKLRERWSK